MAHQRVGGKHRVPLVGVACTAHATGGARCSGAGPASNRWSWVIGSRQCRQCRQAWEHRQHSRTSVVCPPVRMSCLSPPVPATLHSTSTPPLWRSCIGGRRGSTPACPGPPACDLCALNVERVGTISQTHQAQPSPAQGPLPSREQQAPAPRLGWPHRIVPSDTMRRLQRGSGLPPARVKTGRLGFVPLAAAAPPDC